MGVYCFLDKKFGAKENVTVAAFVSTWQALPTTSFGVGKIKNNRLAVALILDDSMQIMKVSFLAPFPCK